MSALQAPRLATRPAAEPPHLPSLRRAFEAARDVPGDFVADPWRFYPVSAERVPGLVWLLARRLEDGAGPDGAAAAYDQWRSVPGWVVVTYPRELDEAREAHLRERALTAVQRFSLSLWADSIRTSWSTDLLPDDRAVADVIGFDPAAEVVLGVVWYGHAERH